MSVTIAIGWWLVPAIITLLSFGAASFMSRDMANDRYGAGAVIALGFYLISAVMALLSWLMRAVLA